MNHLLRILLAAFVLCAASIAAGAASPVKTNGQLRVEGTQLVNAKGKPVQLRGTTPDATKWTDNDLKPWAVVARHYINLNR